MMKKIFLGFIILCILCIAGTFTFAYAGNNAGAAFNVWPDTGQEKYYSSDGEISCPHEGDNFFGQDAQYQGVAHFYTKLGYLDGELIELDDSDTSDNWIMTRDNVTKLIWEIKKRDGSIHDQHKTFTWCSRDGDTNGDNEGACYDSSAEKDTEAFVKALNDSKFGGFDDWRIPTIKELSTLLSMGQEDEDPAIDIDFFPNTIDDNYWSATTSAADSSRAWFVCFNDKCLQRIAKMHENIDKSHAYRVRAVRGGETPVVERYIDNFDGTVTDNATLLMWQKCSLGEIYDADSNECMGNRSWITWKDALRQCEESTFADYDDWRLPNKNELQSIVDYSVFAPAIDSQFFPDLEYCSLEYCLYWTSTTQFDDSSFGSYALYVGFGYGTSCGLQKNDTIGAMARAVRSLFEADVDKDGDVDGSDIYNFHEYLAHNEFDNDTVQQFIETFAKQYGTEW